MAGSFIDGLAAKHANKKMGFGINQDFRAADPARNSLAGYLANNPATMDEIGAIDAMLGREQFGRPDVGYGLPANQGFEGLSDRELQMIAAQIQVDKANANRQGLASMGSPYDAMSNEELQNEADRYLP